MPRRSDSEVPFELLEGVFVDPVRSWRGARERALRGNTRRSVGRGLRSNVCSSSFSVASHGGLGAVTIDLDLVVFSCTETGRAAEECTQTPLLAGLHAALPFSWLPVTYSNSGNSVQPFSK